MSTLESKKNCHGTYPALWRFRYTHSYPEREFRDASGEAVATGKNVTVETQFDVVADNAELATAAANVKKPATVFTRVHGPEFICYIDACVGID